MSQGYSVSPRALEIPALKRAIESKPPALALAEPENYRKSLARVASIESASAYLAPIVQALIRGLRIPAAFHDHALTGGPLRRLRSVIVGEIEGSDTTFVLLYERTRQKINLLWLDQHNDAYETAKLLK